MGALLHAGAHQGGVGLCCGSHTSSFHELKHLLCRVSISCKAGLLVKWMARASLVLSKMIISLIPTEGDLHFHYMSCLGRQIKQMRREPCLLWRRNEAWTQRCDCSGANGRLKLWLESFPRKAGRMCQMLLWCWQPVHFVYMGPSKLGTEYSSYVHRASHAGEVPTMHFPQVHLWEGNDTCTAYAGMSWLASGTLKYLTVVHFTVSDAEVLRDTRAWPLMSVL